MVGLNRGRRDTLYDSGYMGKLSPPASAGQGYFKGTAYSQSTEDISDEQKPGGVGDDRRRQGGQQTATQSKQNVYCRLKGDCVCSRFQRSITILPDKL